MDILQIFLLFGIIFGIMFIVYYVAGARASDQGAAVSVNAIAAATAEADDAINELNGVSKAMFKEFDDKYNNLLFLYNLIDEKKAELLEIETKRPIKASVETKPAKTAFDISRATDSQKEAINLISDGLAEHDIARRLEMSKGEIQLIKELYIKDVGR